jgi:hypothetical protein
MLLAKSSIGLVATAFPLPRFKENRIRDDLELLCGANCCMEQVKHW